MTQDPANERFEGQTQREEARPNAPSISAAEVQNLNSGTVI
jgi:hypothetical protein